MTAGIVATLIFAATLYIVFSEKLNRTIASIAGAASMLVAGMVLGFYNEEQAIAAIDFETIGLLVGMMTLVALIIPTGFFQYLAVRAARFSKGEPLRLLVLLGVITTVLSMFLDNVTTVVLIAPVTILICEILGINSASLLIAEALLSNTGGIATLVGDPPNVLIASASGLTFVDFLTHSLPLVLVIWLVALFTLRFLFRRELAQPPADPDAILSLNPKAALDDWKTARKVLIVLGVAIIFFFFEKMLEISPSFVALTAAAVALVWVRPDIHKTFERVEWSVLVFFVALFILVGGLEAAGVLHALTSVILKVGDSTPVLLGIGILWMVAGLSAVVDNVPMTIAIIPVILELETNGINVQPLWWALAFGAGLGGNGTIIGSTANVVVASLSERTRTPITAKLWNKRGLPVMLVTLVVMTILYVIAYPFYAR
ncbi:MAG: ArsB/NhaD family transporter [Anaerolineaceae bacterium]|nr:ArsB/NhaD family transporter [Anaerolineaceae bacterium]